MFSSLVSRALIKVRKFVYNLIVRVEQIKVFESFSIWKLGVHIVRRVTNSNSLGFILGGFVLNVKWSKL